MFQAARIKLTAWYLLIIMVISVGFSLAAYNRFHRELIRIEFGPTRFERHLFTGPGPEIFFEVRHRLLRAIIVINAAILVLAGASGYWLAGKTLEPIEQMVKEQNRFISDASHELKTPLTSLKTAFEVYLRRRKSAIVSESLAEVNQLQALTENMLKLTYNRPAPPAPVDLGSVLAQAVKQVKPLAKAKNIRLRTAKTKLKIKGNAEQLTELLVILLDNAVKYSPAGSRVEITAQKSDHQAIIKVSDQGIGISANDLPHIFDRFYRADRARTKSNSGGYGLGLAIAKKIIDAHHGTIKVKSQLGQGTTFQLAFSLIN